MKKYIKPVTEVIEVENEYAILATSGPGVSNEYLDPESDFE